MRRNEMTAAIRQEPFEYRAAFNANNQVEYEGWTSPGTGADVAAWLICKNTYTSGNLTRTQWAGKADFNQVWNDRASLFS